jgi:hypothetical protein
MTTDLPSVPLQIHVVCHVFRKHSSPFRPGRSPPDPPLLASLAVRLRRRYLWEWGGLPSLLSSPSLLPFLPPLAKKIGKFQIRPLIRLIRLLVRLIRPLIRLIRLLVRLIRPLVRLIRPLVRLIRLPPCRVSLLLQIVRIHQRFRSLRSIFGIMYSNSLDVPPPPPPPLSVV